eukprot:Skav234909  [mRNA]  locus=scaffold840:818176:819776:+ [translate_table: standard]
MEGNPLDAPAKSSWVSSRIWHHSIGPGPPKVPMAHAGGCHTVLLRSDGTAVACGDNGYEQCNIPALDEGMTYIRISAGFSHTVLLRSDGIAVACGNDAYGQCDIPDLDEGRSYTQISAGDSHTVLLRSDGIAVACNAHTVLLRSDGLALACGNNGSGECDIPAMDEGMSYTQISAGEKHTVLLRSDGIAVAHGSNECGQCDIPVLDEGTFYTQVSAGCIHTVLLRSDGVAVACGSRFDIPALNEGTSYIQVSAGNAHTVLLRSDGCAVACGLNLFGNCDIPLREPDATYWYISDLSVDTTLAVQLEVEYSDDAFTLVCSSLAGEERLRLNAFGSELAWEAHKRIAFALKIGLQSLQVVLPDGQLLAKVCHANPGVTDDGVHGAHGRSGGWQLLRVQRERAEEQRRWLLRSPP